MSMKSYFHIKDWALNLVLIQRPGETRKFYAILLRSAKAWCISLRLCCTLHCCCIIEGASVGVSCFVAQYHICKISSSFYTFSIGGRGPYPLQGSPWSAKPYAYIAQGFPLESEVLCLCLSFNPAHSFCLFPCVGFSKDTHPNNWPMRRSKLLSNVNSSRNLKTSAAFLLPTIFGNWDFYNLLLDLPIHTLDDTLLTIFWKIVEKP